MTRDELPPGGAYALATSVTAGTSLRFRLGEAVHGPALVRDTVTGRIAAKTDAAGPLWTLDIPSSWPSSLYAVDFTGTGGAAEEEVYFAVRPARPGGSMLVSVPFLTWQAYNRAGVPGEGLYPTEGPERAARVTFDRPGGGPAGFWEAPFYAWLARSGYRADYCSNLDLHDGTVDLTGYRLLVSAGHDEYWTAEMRDAAEEFVLRGGNIAFFGGNTCWWQVRLEDGGRTLVCHRDALADPVAATDPRRATVEWSSAPVHRPENTLTGVSFRRGAGCWTDWTAMRHEAYTVAFAGHWAFHGTGLRDGDTFATGAIGYETDAADFDIVDGVPVVTGADGTPTDFVVLATADLRSWRAHGQGGHATMGVMRRGGGTVFNAATICWPGALDDPVVDRITRNVLDRLGSADPHWEPLGTWPAPPTPEPTEPAKTTESAKPATAEQAAPRASAAPVTGSALKALTVCERLLFAADSAGRLAARPCRTQNLRWRVIGAAPGIIALAAPREGVPGCPVRLYGLHADGRILGREPVPHPADWTPLYRSPPGTVAITPIDEVMYAMTADGTVWTRPLDDSRQARWARDETAPLASVPAQPGPFSPGTAPPDAAAPRTPPPGPSPQEAARPGPPPPATVPPGPRDLANLSGRLIAVAGGWLLARTAGGAWTPLDPTPGLVTVTAYGGRVMGGTAAGELWWRDITPADVAAAEAAVSRVGGTPHPTPPRI